MINAEVTLQLEAKPNGSAYLVEWLVPDDLPCFEGHFPGMPVLPAYAFIDLTLEAIRSATGAGTIALLELRSAKFMKPLAPGRKVEIHLSRQTASEWKAVWKDGESVAELTLRL